MQEREEEKMKSKEIKGRMKKTFRKAFAMALISAMIMSQAGFAFADTTTENVPEAPTAPVAESHEDNGKIAEYNSKVDSYNQAAESYNKAVDEEYEAAVKETATKNEEIAQHNAAEEQRVKDAQERNENAQKAADERNAEIDLENEAKKAKAEQDAEEKYQSDLAKYDEDVKQYEKDLEKYAKDVNIETQILNLGYKSVEQYNDLINSNYNEPARRSVEKNASAKELSVEDTYTIEEAAVKSGKMITVRVEHHFEGTDVSYVKEFQIDANDVITLKAIGAPAENTNPGWAAFYYNTDDAHKMGYWSSSYSYLATNAKHNNYGWDCGDSHEVSLKDGTVRANDDDGITVEYYYTWIAQKIYKTYDTPVEPTAPTAPVKGDAAYEATPYVTAEIEEIAAADIWDYVSDPIKKGYLQILTHMELFDVPEFASVAASDDADNASAITEESQKSVASAQTAAVQKEEISDSAAPLTVNGPEGKGTVINEHDVPMAASNGFWALINLIAAALTVILGACMAVFGLRRNDEDSDSKADRRIGARIFGIAAAIASVIAFILTEDMTLTMQMADEWTFLMIAILAVEVLIAAVSRKSKDENEEANAEMINA